MKKQLIAAAVLSTFAGVAAAQSTVTLFGVADVGISNYKSSSTASSVTAMAPGNQSGNRWGLRGSEDLGSGLKANFWLESGFNIDNGTSAQNGRLFGRQAWVGVSGGFGEVRFGRQNVNSSVVLGGLDAFGQGFSMASLAGSMLSATTMRTDNTLGYFSPTIGGFQVALQHSLDNETTASGSGATQVLAQSEQASNNNTHTALTLRYAAGPLVAALTYDTIANQTAGAPNQKMWTLGGAYDFGVARLTAVFADESDVFASGGTGGSTNTSTAASYVGVAGGTASGGAGGPSGVSTDSRSYALGVTVPMDALMLHAQYQRRNDKSASNRDFAIVSVGATYALSKRTNLYTTFADRSAKGAALDASADTREQREFTLGMRHQF